MDSASNSLARAWPFQIKSSNLVKPLHFDSSKSSLHLSCSEPPGPHPIILTFGHSQCLSMPSLKLSSCNIAAASLPSVCSPFVAIHFATTSHCTVLSLFVFVFLLGSSHFPSVTFADSKGWAFRALLRQLLRGRPETVHKSREILLQGPACVLPTDSVLASRSRSRSLSGHFFFSLAFRHRGVASIWGAALHKSRSSSFSQSEKANSSFRLVRASLSGQTNGSRAEFMKFQHSRRECSTYDSLQFPSCSGFWIFSPSLLGEFLTFRPF